MAAPKPRQDGLFDWEKLWGKESDPGLETIKTKFRKSLVDRAAKRIVRQAGYGRWLVMGDRKLGDEYDDYEVTLDGRTYSCTCYGHQYGGSRAKRVCSHVLAVIMYRKTHRDDESQFKPSPEYAKCVAQCPLCDKHVFILWPGKKNERGKYAPDVTASGICPKCGGHVTFRWVKWIGRPGK